MGSKALAKELLGLEKDYWRAMKRKDVEAMHALTDHPCIVAGAQGVAAIDKKHMSAMMKDAPWALRDFEFDDDIEVRRLSDDVAVVAYKVHEDLTVGGKAIPLDAAETSVWNHRDKGWRCALHTESISGDPFGRDRQSQVTQ